MIAAITTTTTTLVTNSPAASAAAVWVGPAIIAAAVAGVVSLAAIWLNGRLARLDRQRQLFAAAFAACQTYKEYPYIVRRRRRDKEAAADKTRISTDLSGVQQSLNQHVAMLRVEAPAVGEAYKTLVGATRRIAGTEISRNWEAPAPAGEGMSIPDIVLDGMEEYEDAYLDAVQKHLRYWSIPAKRASS